MPFVDIRMVGQATREQKAAVAADVTRSLVERLGKSPATVQINFVELSAESVALGGQLIADRAPVAEVAAANGHR